MADVRSLPQRAWALRAYWIVPVVVAVVLIAALVALGGGDSRPFVYPDH